METALLLFLLPMVSSALGQSVYLSFDNKNITDNNTEIVITSIGENATTGVTCLTDLTACCGSGDTMGGQWLYPNGTVVPSGDAGEGFYTLRNTPQSVELVRRRGVDPLGPTGAYCCSVPTFGGDMTFCINLVVCLSLSLTNGTIAYSDPTLGMGSVATHSCNRGFALSASDGTRECRADGQWSDSSLVCSVPPVYLSLSSTNYLSGLSEILLSSVGEGRGSSLVCHTDLSTCCQQMNSTVGDGGGAWHYPNGSSVSEEGDLYVSRDRQLVSLSRRTSAQPPPGVYCCVVPTTKGILHHCIVLVPEVMPLITGATEGFTDSGPGVCQVDNTITIAVVGTGTALIAVVVIAVTVLLLTCLLKRRPKPSNRPAPYELPVPMPNKKTDHQTVTREMHAYSIVDTTYEEINLEHDNVYDFVGNEAYVKSKERDSCRDSRVYERVPVVPQRPT